MRHKYLWLLLLGMLAAGVARAQEATVPGAIPPCAITQLQQAEALIAQGKSEEAYALLEPLEPEQAGNVQYDYLLGVSAVNSGKASRAVFALERVQALDPGYRDARLWLAIAYYQSGDLERAKSGFEFVVAQGGNDETKAKAEHYLAAIRQREAGEAGQSSLRGKVEVGIGHDSNIVNSSQAYLSAFQLMAALPAPASNQAGMESILNLGVEGRVPVSGQYAFASVEDDMRSYPGHGVMNADTLTVRGGMDVAHNGNSYRFSADWRQFRQQGTAYSVTGSVNDYTMTGVEARVRHPLSAQDHLGLLLQYNQLRFVSSNTEDTNQVLLGANYMHMFQSNGSPLLYVGYSNLSDQAVRPKLALNPLYGDGTTVASRNTDIFTLYLQYSLSKDVDAFSTDYVYFRRDSGAFARDAVIDYGKDKTSFFSLGITWRPKPQWSMRTQLGKTLNSSNIALYSYSKVEGIVLLRRDFN